MDLGIDKGSAKMLVRNLLLLPHLGNLGVAAFEYPHQV